MNYGCHLNDEDYALVRLARIQGRLLYPVTRKVGSGQTLFAVPRGHERKFCEQLESVIDFGGTSAAEIFNINLYQP